MSVKQTGHMHAMGNVRLETWVRAFRSLAAGYILQSKQAAARKGPVHWKHRSRSKVAFKHFFSFFSTLVSLLKKNKYCSSSPTPWILLTSLSQASLWMFSPLTIGSEKYMYVVVILVFRLYFFFNPHLNICFPFCMLHIVLRMTIMRTYWKRIVAEDMQVVEYTAERRKKSNVSQCHCLPLSSLNVTRRSCRPFSCTQFFFWVWLVSQQGVNLCNCLWGHLGQNLRRIEGEKKTTLISL